MYELEALYELEDELEGELEDEFEDEWEGEGEEFLGDAWGWLTRSGSRQRRVALAASKAALTGGGTAGGAALGALAGGVGAPIGGVLGGTLGSGLAALLPDKELEDELEWQMPSGGSVDAAMEHLGDMACRAPTNREAEAFIGAIIPLAAKLLPKAASVIRRVAPRLIRGASSVVRTLRRSPATRGLVKAVPTIVKGTAMDIARRAARGQPITSRGAARILAKNTARTLGGRSRCNAALRRCTLLNRRYVAQIRALRARR